MKTTATGVGAFAILVLVCLGTLLVCPLVDPSDSKIELSRVFDRSIPLSENTDAVIFFRIRLPRALFGALVGFGLSIAGAVFQALLRNDLATPYTLGLSGGSTLGALIMLRLAPATLLGSLTVPLGAFVGASAVLGFIGLLGRWLKGGTQTNTILLAGVTLNLFFSSFILLLQYLADPYELLHMIRWMMGGLNVTTVKIPIALFGPTLLCGVGLFLLARSLDLISLGDDAAHHLGVEVSRTRWLALGLAGLMTALLVAYSGPIGFVGLIVPHTVRRLFGPGHRFLLPASGLLGASFLVWCDTLARTAYAGHEIPVGIITAFFGAPFFLFILVRSSRRVSS